MSESEGFYTLLISHNNEECTIAFSPIKKEIVYIGNNSLLQFLKLKEYQLRKLLHNKKKESFFIGFELNFVLHDGLPDTDFYDKSKITILDNSKNQFIVIKSSSKSNDITELYTDGSYNHEKKKGGYAILIKKSPGNYMMKQTNASGNGNNLMELLAVIEGLKVLKEENKIRIVTDSQYVIKGITEWLPLWKLNDFYTANGTKAKNLDSWKEVDFLVKGKYIEFEWVKSHSEHFENSLCDLKAKSVIKS